jgi:hypothetical protein
MQFSVRTEKGKNGKMEKSHGVSLSRDYRAKPHAKAQRREE